MVETKRQVKKVISINKPKVDELYNLIQASGPMLIADAMLHFGNRIIAELIIEHEDVKLVPDGGVLQMKDNA